MSGFSAKNRSTILQRLQSEEYDLTIIGGGITGAGIALDAVMRGLKVALIEKDDFASGTSSRSTKLIHGGLRYLKQMDFGLVRETGRERAVVHKMAPHLVVPEKMLLPLIEGGTYGYLSSSFGLAVYDILAGVAKKDRRRMLNKSETLEKEPLLNPDNLRGSGYYAEYRTDDARLTIENAKSAVKRGATLINYIQADDFIEENGKVVGVNCTDINTGKKLHIRSKSVVAAAGPWVDLLRKKNNSLKGKRLHLTKGVHIVVDHSRFPLKQSLYFDVPDGRMIFSIPRGAKTYIGTTDTDYHGKIEDVNTNLVDAEYLINSVNDIFPEMDLSINDVESSWAGLRPLIHEDGKSASELSRKDEIFVAPNDLISIAGGKLTGYRKMGERIVDLVYEKFFDSSPKCKTHKIDLCGGDFLDYIAVEQYIEKLAKQLEAFKLDQTVAKRLVHLFGTQCDDVLPLIEKFSANYDPEEALLLAELEYCLEHEMVLSPKDFFIRRTGRLYFDINSVKKMKELVLDYMKGYFAWEPEQRSKMAAELEIEIAKAVAFKQEVPVNA